VTPDDLIRRLLDIEVSALCDADKSLPVADPAIRAMAPNVRFAGPAVTVVAPDDPPAAVRRARGGRGRRRAGHRQ
jgi:regulator of RNase E activity RraA